MSIKVGSVVEGVVTGIANFGAFVQLNKEQNGLVHISEISNEFVKDINDYVSKGDKVKVKVLSIEDNGNIALSMKDALPEQEGPEEIQLNTDVRKTDDMSFDDMLNRFMKDSNEKIESAKQRRNVRQGKTKK